MTLNVIRQVLGLFCSQTDSYANSSQNIILPTCCWGTYCTSYLCTSSVIFATHVRYTHTQPFTGPFSGTTQVSRYQVGKTNLDLTEARDSERQWHQLGRMQVCTLLQTDNHTSTSSLSFLQAGCPSCCPTNSVKALKDTCVRSRYKILVVVKAIAHIFHPHKVKLH